MTSDSKAYIHQQIIAANCYIRDGNKYLMMKRSSQKKYAPGFVQPVGGKVDQGENPYTAVLREVKEETGLDVKDVKLEAVILDIGSVADEPNDWSVFYFSANVAGGEQIETDEGELVWLTAEEIAKEKLYPSAREVIDHMLNKEKGTVFATFQYDGTEHHIVNKKIDICKA